MTRTPEEPNAPSMLRSEQHLRIDRQRVATERVRVRRRVVSEIRQLSMTVRREELVIDREPLPDSPVDTITPRTHWSSCCAKKFPSSTCAPAPTKKSPSPLNS